MTSQMPLTLQPGDAVPIGTAAGLVEGLTGGVVFLHGDAVFAWDGDDVGGRRWAAVQLVRIKAAKRWEVAAGFGVSTQALWRWEQEVSALGVAGVAPGKPGPKGAWKLTEAVVAQIRGLHAEQKTLAQIAKVVGVSTFSVRVALGRVGNKTTGSTLPPLAADPQHPVTTPPAVDTEAADDTEPEADIERRTRCAATGSAQQALPGWDDEPAIQTGPVVDTDTDAQPAAADVDTEPVVDAGTGPVVDAGTGPVADAGGPAGQAGGRSGPGGASRVGVVLPVLPDVVCRGGERALARSGLLECATPVFTPGARYPLVGLLLILPALADTGLLQVAEQVYGRVRNGFYGLSSVLLEATFRALLGQAEAATRIPPADLGRVLGLDRAPEVKTIRRKIGELASRGKAADLVAGMAARHATGRPEQVGFLYCDGHVRVYCGTRTVQKTHLARLRFPAPATLETWFNDAAGQPVFVVPAEPSASLVSELRRLIPDLRAVVGPDRKVSVGFDRGGESPALFADLIGAGFDVLTYRKGAVADLPESAFTTATHTDEYARAHTYTLAETTITLDITQGARQGQSVTMRQVTKRRPDGHQVHVLTTRTDLDAPQVAYRMFSRWRQENYFRYARTHVDLDAHDSFAVTPDDPDRRVPNPAKKSAYAAVVKARRGAQAAQATSEGALLAVRSADPGHDLTPTDPTLAAINAPLHAAQATLQAALTTHRAIPSRVRLGDLAPGTVLLDTETKLITHAVRMAAYNATTALARALYGIYPRADDEAYALIRDALSGSGDLHPAGAVLHVRLDPRSAPRHTRALAALCEQLNATQTHYPGTDLVLHYEVKPHQ